MKKQKYVIIVAGGSGKRMGNDIPKQFLPMNKLPILMHTIKAFYEFDSAIKIIVVLPEDQHNYWNELVRKYKFKIAHEIANGGTERFYSVHNGLQLVNYNGLVAVHDGVRPLVSKNVIMDCFDKAELKGAVIPVLPSNESIRKINEDENVALNRSEYFMVQTPQVFETELLKKAYEQSFSSLFTDDASVVEAAGYTVSHVEGNVENIKITRPIDLVIAEALLK